MLTQSKAVGGGSAVCGTRPAHRPWAATSSVLCPSRSELCECDPSPHQSPAGELLSPGSPSGTWDAEPEPGPRGHLHQVKKYALRALRIITQTSSSLSIQLPSSEIPRPPGRGEALRPHCSGPLQSWAPRLSSPPAWPLCSRTPHPSTLNPASASLDPRQASPRLSTRSRRTSHAKKSVP